MFVDKANSFAHCDEGAGARSEISRGAFVILQSNRVGVFVTLLYVANYAFNTIRRYNVSAVDNEKSAFDAEFFVNDPNFNWNALAKREMAVPALPELTQIPAKKETKNEGNFNPLGDDFAGDQRLFYDF